MRISDSLYSKLKLFAVSDGEDDDASGDSKFADQTFLTSVT